VASHSQCVLDSGESLSVCTGGVSGESLSVCTGEW